MPALLALLVPAALAVEAPTFSVERGLYDAAFTLEITPADAADTLLVSTDGATPTAAYTGPLTIDGTTLVRAVAVAPDGGSSSVQTHTYLFVADVIASPDMARAITGDPTYGPILTETLSELPTISLVTDSLTLSEHAASFEWIDPGGEDLQIDVGAKRTGNTSIYYPKNHVRVYFRDDYGGPLELDLYGQGYLGVPPEDRFEDLNLRSGGHDSVFYLVDRGQYLRNRWMDNSQLEMGHMAPHGRFAHLYVNGGYQGLYHVRERFDGDFLAAYLGGDSHDYEVVNGGTATQGDGSVWNTIVALSGDYQSVKAYLDTENFVDYMILNFYAANAWDWSAYHNWIAGGPSDPDRARYIFHSSDNDICLYYDWTTNILDNPGPGYVWYYLKTEWDPDFATLVADRIHANLEDGGPLTAERAAARYQDLADEASDAVVAESARWGGGTWDRDGEWATERDNLLANFFPKRTDELLRQLRAVGWYPLDAPELSLEAGLITAGETLTVSVPDGVDAELWVSADGGDPREAGGAVAAGALGPDPAQDFNLNYSTLIKARLLQDDTWGPVQTSFFEVDATPPVVLNEWNAVADDETLRDGGQDQALGEVVGNGGDWFELLVVEDHVDLRGWRITLTDRLGEIATLTFTDAAVLSDLRSGTLFTVSEDLPEDTTLDPARGDWRFHLRAGAEGSGEVISATDFDVGEREWQLTLWDGEGHVRFGPAGEGVWPADGISRREVGQLQATPDLGVRRDSPWYGDSKDSSYGYPNEGQDLSALRAVVEPEAGPDTGDTGGQDTAAPDSGQAADTAEVAGPAQADKGGACGCGTGGASALAPALLALLLAISRRRAPALALLAACADKAGETGPRESGGAETSESAPPADSDACFADADGDGAGDPDESAPCEGGVARATDCDDADPDVHPGAWEVCDGVDNDCDALIDDADDDLTDGLPFYTDGDGDGYGVDEPVVTACSRTEGLTWTGGDCDDGDPAISPGAVEACDDIDQDCDGVANDGLGTSEACAVSSCLEIITADPTAPDGLYYLTLPSGTTAAIYCDMSTDGGGWTLAMLRSSVSTGSQGDFGAGDESPDDLDQSPEDASLSADARLAWLDMNAFDWDDLRLSAAYMGAQTYLSEDIPREQLRISFGENGYLLYGGESPYYWCGGDSSYTDGGVGATNNPAGASPDCKSHGSLGSGWDFSTMDYANTGLTLCGGDGSAIMLAYWGSTWVYYGAVGAAYALWVR